MKSPCLLLTFLAAMACALHAEPVDPFLGTSRGGDVFIFCTGGGNFDDELLAAPSSVQISQEEVVPLSSFPGRPSCAVEKCLSASRNQPSDLGTKIPPPSVSVSSSTAKTP